MTGQCRHIFTMSNKFGFFGFPIIEEKEASVAQFPTQPDFDQTPYSSALTSRIESNLSSAARTDMAHQLPKYSWQYSSLLEYYEDIGGYALQQFRNQHCKTCIDKRCKKINPKKFGDYCGVHKADAFLSSLNESTKTLSSVKSEKNILENKVDNLTNKIEHLETKALNVSRQISSIELNIQEGVKSIKNLDAKFDLRVQQKYGEYVSVVCKHNKMVDLVNDIRGSKLPHYQIISFDQIVLDKQTSDSILEFLDNKARSIFASQVKKTELLIN